MAHSSNFIGSDCRLANNISAISCWCSYVLCQYS